MNTIGLLIPDISTILLGFVLRRASGWPKPFWDNLEKLVYFILFPALLVSSLLRSPLSVARDGPAVANTLIALAASIALAWLARPVLDPLPRHFASGAQCGFRFNTYLALALAQTLGGQEGLALCAVFVGFVVPTVNVAAVLPLAKHAGTGVMRELMRNPLLLATVTGLTGNLLGIQLPTVVDATLGRLGSAAIALGLIAVGAGLVLSRSEALGDREKRSSRSLAVWITAVKLLAMPTVALLCGLLLELEPMPLSISVMFCALPTATSCYILASRMGGDGEYVAYLITVSMLVSLVTLPFWLALVT
ncbi:MAG: AEC family transporter [Pseudomonadota bacterium]|nr:AEC family transporter [Pseudomonadota bacterium]